jgi:aspartate dehydrogenase
LQARGLTPEGLEQPLVLFEGAARDAAKRYPANLNVAATLAIAGCGFDDTRVKVIIDPALQGNSHTITVTSDHGRMEICLANAPSPANPKSSWIVGKSVVAAVQNYLSPCMML